MSHRPTDSPASQSEESLASANALVPPPHLLEAPPSGRPRPFLRRGPASRPSPKETGDPLGFRRGPDFLPAFPASQVESEVEESPPYRADVLRCVREEGTSSLNHETRDPSPPASAHNFAYPNPLLDALESVLYIFLRNAAIVVWFCCFYRCCGIKKKKNWKKIKYLKCSNKIGFLLF